MISGSFSACQGNVRTEVNIYKPKNYLRLCSVDFVSKELRDSSDINFVVYESATNDVNSSYILYVCFHGNVLCFRLSSITRSSASGNIITKLVSDPVDLRIGE